MRDYTPTAPPSSARQVVFGQVAIGLLLIAASVGAVVWQWKWVEGVMNGPAGATAEQLATLTDPAQLQNQWVRFTAEQVVETGLQTRSRKTNNIRSRFLLARVKDRWLVAEVPVGMAGNQLTGYLGVWTHQQGRDVVAAVAAQHPDAALLPFQLNAYKDQKVDCFLMLGLAGFFCLGGFFALSLGLNGGGGPPQRSQVDAGDVFSTTFESANRRR